MKDFIPSRRARVWFFGIFFVLFTLQCTPLRTQTSSLYGERFDGNSAEEVLSWAELENRRNPDEPEPYLIRAQASFDVAKKTADIPGRKTWYAELRLAMDEFDKKRYSWSDRWTAERDSILNRAWSFEFTKVIPLLSDDIDPLNDSSDNREELARAHLENAFLIEPDSLQSREWLATLYYQSGDPMKALDLLKSGQNSNSIHLPTYQEKLAWLYLETGDIESAISIYEELNAQFNVTKRLRIAYVNALLMNGEQQTAVELLQTLAQDYPNDPDLKKALFLESLHHLNDLLSLETVDITKNDDIQSAFSESFRLLDLISSVSAQPAIWWSSGYPSLNGRIPPQAQRDDLLSFLMEATDYFNQIFQTLEQIRQVSDEAHRLIMDDFLRSLYSNARPFFEQLFENQPESAELAEKLLLMYSELGLTSEADELRKRLL